MKFVLLASGKVGTQNDAEMIDDDDNDDDENDNNDNSDDMMIIVTMTKMSVTMLMI